MRDTSLMQITGKSPASDRPGEEHPTDGIHKYLVLAGTIWVLFIALASALVFPYLIQLDHARYRHSYIPFASIEAAVLAGALALYVIRKNPAYRTGATVAFLFLIMAFNAAMGILTGGPAGFQLLNLPFIAIAYLALTVSPRRRLAATAAAGLICSSLFIWQAYVDPRLPLPDFIAGPVYTGLAAITAAIFLAGLFFLARRYGLIRRSVAWWVLLTEKGNELYTDSDDIKVNTIFNGGLIVYGALIIVTVATTIAVYLILLGMDAARYRDYLPVYIAPELAMLGIIAFTYVRKNRRVRPLVYETTILIASSVYYGAISMLLGKNAGFQFFMFVLFPGAFLLLRTYRKTLALMEIVSAAATVFVFWWIYTHPAMFPVPGFIEEFSFVAFSSSIALSYLVAAAYLWWELDVFGRLMKAWDRLSNAGIHLYEDVSAKKVNVIINKIFILFIMSNSAVVTGITMLYVYLVSTDPARYRDYIYYYLPAPLVQIALLLLFYIMKNIRGHSPLFSALGMVTGVVTTITLSMLLGQDGGYHFVLFAFICVPFLGIGIVPRPYLFTINGVTFAGLIFIYTWFMLFPAIRPIPEFFEMALRFSLLVFTALMILAMSYFMGIGTSTLEINLNQEREKSDMLLLNILPRHIADELKETGSAKPVHFQSATVLFTDFVGFTRISESLTPEEIVRELDACFSRFDSIIDRYNLEKLKTIGDAYMAAGGVPVPNATSAIDCALAALDIMSSMKRMQTDKEAQGLPYWEIRCGINTGDLVAGVVGEKKFAYDVWGDTVNTASRMESGGTPGRINISKSTYEAIKYFFTCRYRGKISAKNKGMLDMYYLEGIKPHYSVGGEGIEPNDEFRRMFEKIAAGARICYRSEISN